MRKLWPMGGTKVPAERKLRELMNNDTYIAQEKLDGIRALMHFEKDGSVRWTTRGSSVDSPDEPIEITHRVEHILNGRKFP